MTLSLEERISICVNAAVEKQASDIVILDLKGLSTIAESFLICSANSIRQAQAIADTIDETMGRQKEEPGGVEGYAHGRWILMDYNDLVVQIFLEEARRFYDIERLWAKAPTREISAAR